MILSQRLSFDIKYQKQIDRCKKILIAYSMIGQAAWRASEVIQYTIDSAQEARANKDMMKMIKVYNEMKEIKK